MSAWKTTTRTCAMTSWHDGYQCGAAVAFGLMGMAEAIRGRYVQRWDVEIGAPLPPPRMVLESDGEKP